MTSSRVLVALLCFTTWVSVVQATHAPKSSCKCVGWSTKTVSPRLVVNYTLQTEPACDINAVVFNYRFQGRGEGKICSDPNSNWAKKVIRKVNKEKIKQSLLQQNRQKEDASTSAASPAPPHQRRLTSAASPAPSHQHRLTSAASPAPSHQRRLTSAVSPAPPHQRRLTSGAVENYAAERNAGKEGDARKKESREGRQSKT